VNPPLSINLTAGSLSVCPNVNAPVSVSVTGGDGNYNYNWMPGNVSTSSITVNLQSSTIFTVTVSDGCGSAPVTNSVNVTVYPTQVPTFNSTDAAGCEPLCVQFSNTTPSVTSVYWAFGDFGAAVVSPVATHCYNKSGNYTINLITTDQKGCKSSLILPDYVTVYGKPKADYVYTPEQIDLNSPDVTFKNSSVNASQLTWVLDGKLLSTKQSVDYTFYDEGCYHLKLIAANDNFCSDTTDRLICVNIGFNIYVPDAFTPNEDKHNEIFIPKGTDWLPDNYSFTILDRWGLVVFKTSSITEGWNGKMAGTDATDDIYIWQIVVNDIYGQEHHLNGKVMLIR
ncbi:MAG: PKD domain-containing protein, partial [Bacteroidia bacterium]